MLRELCSLTPTLTLTLTPTLTLALTLTKVAMLRELCFLQSFVARLIMVGLPLLTLLAPNPNPNPTPTPNSSPSPHPHPPRWACSSSSY